jgi:sugar phosphate isomerase/epimerase
MAVRKASKRTPLIPRERLMVTPGVQDNGELRIAREYGLGAEVQTFSFPGILAEDFTPLLRRMAKRVMPLKGPIGCHGPFIDTAHYSLDVEIMRVCRMRYMQAFAVAEQLGAKFIVVHSQYNPLVRIPEYPTIYHEQSLKFWPDIIREAERRRVRLYLENMFDDSPKPLCRLAAAIDSPYFQLCLDVAHASLFSEVDIADWVSSFRPHLRHVHLNDCHGKHDDHLGLGQGVLDIALALDLLRKTRRKLTYALETGKHTRASLRYLGLGKV